MLLLILNIVQRNLSTDAHPEANGHIRLVLCINTIPTPKDDDPLGTYANFIVRISDIFSLIIPKCSSQISSGVMRE